MKALVTGAAGFIGSHLIPRLLDSGAEVVGIDCFADYYARSVKERNLEPLLARPAFRFVEDMIQTAPLDALLDGVTTVFHLAAQAGVRKSWGEDFRVYTTHNVDATQRLLEAVKDRRLHRFVYASSSSVYGDVATIPMREDSYLQPVSPYGVTKLAAEHLCHLYHVNYGLPAVSLRYFTVYGPRQRPEMAIAKFVDAVLDGRKIPFYGDGSSRRDYTYIDDIVDGVVRSLDRCEGYEIYNLGESATTSLAELVEQIGRLCGKTPILDRQPMQPGDVLLTCADVSKARAKLGYAPKVPVAEGLRRYVEWVRASELKGRSRTSTHS
jgi:UDP-glucose 4-epimerase